jgi:aspartyl-tRNA(Asn)/glutamyl-tRNA(Gln) amidotransferase subunit C
MSVTPEMVERVARLAGLELTMAERVEQARNLGRILEYVDRLGGLALDEVQAGAGHPLPQLALREDEPRRGLTVEEALAGAPDRQGSSFRVPIVVARGANGGGDDDVEAPA